MHNSLYKARATYNKTSLKGIPNKGHNTFNLSIKNNFYGLQRTMVIQFYLNLFITVNIGYK